MKSSELYYATKFIGITASLTWGNLISLGGSHYVISKINPSKPTNEKIRLALEAIFGFAFLTFAGTGLYRSIQEKYTAGFVDFLISGIFLSCIAHCQPKKTLKETKTQILNHLPYGINKPHLFQTNDKTPLAYGMEKQLEIMAIWLRRPFRDETQFLHVWGPSKSGKRSLILEFQRKIAQGDYEDLKDYLFLEVDHPTFLKGGAQQCVKKITDLSKQYPRLVLVFDRPDTWQNHFLVTNRNEITRLNIRFIFRTSFSSDFDVMLQLTTSISTPTLSKDNIKEMVLAIKLKLWEKTFDVTVSEVAIDKAIELIEREKIKNGSPPLAFRVLTLLESACTNKKGTSSKKTPVQNSSSVNLNLQKVELTKEDVIRTHQLQQNTPDIPRNDKILAESSKVMTAIDTTIGLDAVFEELLLTLALPIGKCNVLLVGEKCTGKTTLVHQLERMLGGTEIPKLKGRSLIKVDVPLGALQFNMSSDYLTNPEKYIVLIEDIDLFDFKGVFGLFNPHSIIIATIRPSNKQNLHKEVLRNFKEIEVPPIGETDVRTLLNSKMKDIFEMRYDVTFAQDTIERAIENAKVRLTTLRNSANQRDKTLRISEPKSYPSLLEISMDYLEKACFKALYLSPRNTHDLDDEKEEQKMDEHSIFIESSSEPIRKKRTQVLPKHLPLLPAPKEIEPASWLINLTTDLKEKLAEKGKLEPIVFNREIELSDMFGKLATKSEKSNVLFLGEPGCGKTKLVEEFARRLLMKAYPAKFKGRFEGVQIICINYNLLMSNTMWFGQIEGKFKDIGALDKDKVILFIDEVHMLVPKNSADNRDLANKLKTLLLSGLRFIGATTLKEYEERMKADPAFCRRFKQITISTMEKDEVYSTLQLARKSRFEDKFHVSLSDEAIKVAVEFYADEKNRHGIPGIIDPAISLLEEVCTLMEPDQENIDPSNYPKIDASVVYKSLSNKKSIDAVD